VGPEARSTAGVEDEGPCLGEQGEQALLGSLDPHLAGCGYDEHPHPLRHRLAGHHLRRQAQVVDPTVRARADHHLVHPLPRNLRDRHHMVHVRRARHLGLKPAHVEPDRVLVTGVGIGVDGGEGTVGARREVAKRDLIRGEERVLGPHLRGHVRDHHPVGDRHPRDEGARELHGLVEGAVGAKLSDHVEDHVLGGDELGKGSIELDAEARRDLEPQLPGRPQGGHLRAADPGGERPHRAVGRGMGVRPQHEVPRPGQRLLHHHLVAHPAPNVVEPDPLLAHELPDLLMVLGVLHARGGHDMVEDDHELLRLLDPLPADLPEQFGDRRRVVVGHPQVRPHGHDLPRLHGSEARLLGEDLLGERLSHRASFTESRRT